MMNKIVTIGISWCIMIVMGCGSFVFAQTSYYGSSNGSVVDIIDNMQKKNTVVSSVFEDKVNIYTKAKANWFGSENRIANGAWILVLSLSPYIQWLVFLGMSCSVILIIYNGFLITTNAGDDGQIKTAKTNITNILTGVLILSGFYFILKIISGLLLNLISG